LQVRVLFREMSEAVSAETLIASLSEIPDVRKE